MGFRLFQHYMLQLLAFGFYSAVQSPTPANTGHRNCVLNLASSLNTKEDTMRRHLVSCWGSQIHLSSGRKIYRNNLGYFL